MFVRIVKMKFERENIPSFKEVFEGSKETIRNFEGCNFLELYQDKKDECIFFTYSHWEAEEHLEAYRQSDFFKSVWSKTKTLFSNKPEAWSVDKLESLPQFLLLPKGRSYKHFESKFDLASGSIEIRCLILQAKS